MNQQITIDRAEYERLKALEEQQLAFLAPEPQMLDTGRFGQILVVQTWMLKEKSISKLANGGYCHTSGLPITTEKEITDAIPPGPDRDAALHWLEHRHEAGKQEEQQGIMVHPDLSMTLADGTPVKSITDITQAIKSGPHQEWLVRLFLSQESTKTKDIPGWMEPKEEKDEASAAPPAPSPSRRRPVKKKSASKPAPLAQPPA